MMLRLVWAAAMRPSHSLTHDTGKTFCRKADILK